MSSIVKHEIFSYRPQKRRLLDWINGSQLFEIIFEDVVIISNCSNPNAIVDALNRGYDVGYADGSRHQRVKDKEIFWVHYDGPKIAVKGK